MAALALMPVIILGQPQPVMWQGGGCVCMYIHMHVCALDEHNPLMLSRQDAEHKGKRRGRRLDKSIIQASTCLPATIPPLPAGALGDELGLGRRRCGTLALPLALFIILRIHAAKRKGCGGGWVQEKRRKRCERQRQDARLHGFWWWADHGSLQNK